MVTFTFSISIFILYNATSNRGMALLEKLCIIIITIINYVRDVFKRIIQEDNTKSDALNVKTGSQDRCRPDPILKFKGRFRRSSATLTRAWPGSSAGLPDRLGA